MMAQHPNDPVQVQVEQWYNHYGKLVAHHIISKVDVDHQTIEDLTHEVFHRALRYLRNPSPDPITSPKDWLIKIADNVCRQRTRDTQREAQHFTVVSASARSPHASQEDEHTVDIERIKDEDNQPERRAEQRELVSTLYEGIAALPARVRDVVQLHYFQGLKYQEIADRSGRTPGTIGRDVRNGLRELRKRMLYQEHHAVDNKGNDNDIYFQ